MVDFITLPGLIVFSRKDLYKAWRVAGKPAGYSYFVGGSTGGRQGMMEACDGNDNVIDGVIDDPVSCTWAEFEQLFNQSVDQYTEVIGTENTNLTGFRDHGGKLIIIHGLAYQLVPPQGTIEYFRKVQKMMGGTEATSEFARLFLIPGTDHSLSGAGPSPVGNLDALIRRVEEGKAPEYLNTIKNDKPGKIIKPY